MIGAPNIVLDLNGHTVDGIDYLTEPTGQEEGLPAGIRNSGHSNVVVRNGTVQQFGYGVLLTAGTTHTTIDGVDMRRNALAGLELFDADDGRNGNTVTNSTIADNEVGVHLLGGTEHARLIDNEIAGNLGEQLLILGGGHNHVEEQHVPRHPVGPGAGLRRRPRARGHLGQHAPRQHRARHGRRGDHHQRGLAPQPRARRLLLPQRRRRCGHRRLRPQRGRGRHRAPAVRRRHRRRRSATTRCCATTTCASTRPAWRPRTPTTSCSRATTPPRACSPASSSPTGSACGSSATPRDRTGANGILLESGVFDAAGAPIGGALLEGNRTDENGASGIVVSEGGHTLRANRAHNNIAWGIDADTNNFDGGSNRASGNGQAEQCTGVACITTDAVPLVGPDLTAPETTIDTRPAHPSGQASATFTFSSTDARTPATAMVHECRLDPGPDPLPEPPDIEPPGPGELPDTPPDGEGWFECVSPIHFADLDEGEHRFEVRALDQGDNRDLTPAAYEWTIEPAPPGEDTTPGHARARDAADRAAGRPDDRHHGDVPLPRLRRPHAGPGPALRVRARRRRLRAVREPAHADRRRRHAHLRRARARPHRQRRPRARVAHVDGQRPAAGHDAARHPDRLRPGPHDRAHRRHLHARRERARRDARMHAQRRRRSRTAPRRSS